MTSTFPDVSISTERLVLRAFEPGDVPALTEMMNDEQVVAWCGAPQPYTRQHAARWVAEGAPAERAEGRGIALAVTEFLTQRLVGAVRLTDTDWHTLTTRAGAATAPWARGEGYATESLLALAQWLLRDRKFERLEVRTATDNTAAQQVAQKTGCISEGVLRHAGIVRSRTEDGGWTDMRTDLIVWSLLAEDLEGVVEHMAEGGGYAPLADWH